MSIEIHEVLDYERGCGWREPGGLYLRSDTAAQPCGRLPVPLGACTGCGRPWRAVKGWTVVDLGELFAGKICLESRLRCESCCLKTPTGMAGLLWVASTHYRTPDLFLYESRELGVSKRIPDVPDWFEIGTSVVLLAHCRVLDVGIEGLRKGIFAAFVPTRVEYVVRDDDTAENLPALIDHGITPVTVRRSEFPLPAPLLERPE